MIGGRVMDDNRIYECMCLLRAIASEDGMMADFLILIKKFIQSISNKIINNITGINKLFMTSLLNHPVKLN